MKFKSKLAAILLAFGILASPGVACADPVSAAVAAWDFVASVFTSATLWATVARIGVSVGLSLLAQALQKKQSGTGGVKTSTSTGGSTAQTFILGKYATGGQLAVPLNAYGSDGGTPNAYLTFVVALGCIPGQTLSRLIISDNYVTVDSEPSTIGGADTQGFAVQGDYAGNAWIRVYDGTQTTADPLLVEKFSSDPDRPWSTAMVGTGIPYVVAVFKYNTSLYSGIPSLRFECNGIPLYDPRLDSSVGGSGTHRWGTPSTYTPSANLALMIYNIMRGIALKDGSTWGGESLAEDLPLDNWFTALNACDAPVTLGDGTTEPSFAGGYEVSLSDEPADVIDDLLIACSGQMAEVGGVWLIRIGGPGLPVAYFTDDDILVDHTKSQDMFPSLDATYNGVQATQPLPSTLWDSTDAPAIYNATWEAADGNRRLVADLTLNPVYSPTQAQRIMQSYINDDRRFVRHVLSMGPYGSVLEPLDSIAWTSAAESYTDKIFEVTETVESVRQITTQLSLRERDSSDFTPPTEYLPWVAALPGSSLPVAQAVPGWAVAATTLKDADGVDRKPAIALTWNGSDLPDVRAIMWEVRLTATLADVASGTASNVTAGGIVVSDGILPATAYQARGQLVVDRPTDWTSWIDVVTDDVRLAEADLPTELVGQINSSALDVLALYAQMVTLQQLANALLYTGDGRSLQLVSLSAENKATNAIDQLNLIGVLAPDGSAYVLNTSFVKIADDQTLAGFVNTTNSTVGDLTSQVTDTATAVNGVKAMRFMKVEAGNILAGIYESADDTTGTSEVGIYASRFFVADPADPSNVQDLFEVTDTGFRLHTNLEVPGGSITAQTITADQIVENGIVTPTGLKLSAPVTGTGSFASVLTGSVEMDKAGTITLLGSAAQQFASGAKDWGIELFVNGNQVEERHGTAFADAPSINGIVDVPAGTVSIGVSWKGGDNTVTLADFTLIILGLKNTSSS